MTTMIQSWLLPVICGMISYFLVHYPTYFGTCFIGFGAVIFSPIGGYLLEPTGVKMIDFASNASANAIAGLLTSTVHKLIAKTENVQRTGAMLKDSAERAIDSSWNKLEITTEKVTTWGKVKLGELVVEMSKLEDLTERAHDFVTEWCTKIFGDDVRKQFEENAAKALSDNGVKQPLIQQLSQVAKDIMGDSSLRDAMLLAMKNAIVDMLQNNEFMDEAIEVVVEKASGFRGLLSLGGQSSLMDPIATMPK